LRVGAAAPLAFAGLHKTARAQGGSTLERLRDQGFVTVAYTNAAPFGFSDRPGSVTGADIETLKIVLPEIGVPDAQFAIVPFGTLIPGIQAARFDLIGLSMGILPARCEQVAFAEPTNCIGAGFAVLKGNPLNLHSFDDVAANSAARLAVVIGSNEARLAKVIGVPDDRVTAYEGQPQALAALRGGRADAVALTAMGIIGMLNAAADESLEHAPPLDDPVIDGRREQLRGSFAKRSEDPDLRAAINGVLAQMRSDGRLEEIYTRFGFLPTMIPGADASETVEALCAG
jgi:polar amino acid transport system substrate-binding protein